jgi:hypothetical protein
MEVVVVLPFLELGVEGAGIVDGNAVDKSEEVLCLDAVGSFNLAVEVSVRGVMETWLMPLTSMCQWKLLWNSEPLSVWVVSRSRACIWHQPSGQSA